MKRILPTLVLVLVLGGLGAARAQAQPKFATVDLRKVFEGYYKTKEADAKLKEDAAGLEKTGKGMLEDYKTANEEYKKMLDGANDQALSADERQRKKKSAEEKLLEIKQLEQQVQQMQRTSQATLLEKRRRMRDSIIKEIREVIVNRARESGVTFVIDSSADSFNQTPILLFNGGDNDLTEPLLAQLNAGAPPDLLQPKPAEEKK